MTVYPKTSGSKGMHLYVAIKHGPKQHEVWAFAKRVAFELAKAHPDILTAEYKIEKRPRNHVLIDYNQNRLGATLASIYSVRPTPEASVSTPVTWDEVETGIDTADFTVKNVPKRVARLGDLWKPLTEKRGRYDLQKLLNGVHA
jgi:bifunctional non-homologous end joining protein LigD